MRQKDIARLANDVMYSLRPAYHGLHVDDTYFKRKVSRSVSGTV